MHMPKWMEVQTDGSVIGKFTFENYCLPIEHMNIIGLTESISWYTSKETCTHVNRQDIKLC